jgi:flagella basal body P-ring formation protein FlgA
MKSLLSIFFLVGVCSSVLGADAELIVPVRTIYPGETLNQTQVTARRFDVREDQILAFVRSIELVEGKVARRTLLANQPIPMGAFEEPRLALVGRQIKVEFREGGLVISTLASVLQAGAVGEMISVRILDGGRTVTGTIQKDGTLRVGEGHS